MTHNKERTQEIEEHFSSFLDNQLTSYWNYLASNSNNKSTLNETVKIVFLIIDKMAQYPNKEIFEEVYFELSEKHGYSDEQISFIVYLFYEAVHYHKIIKLVPYQNENAYKRYQQFFYYVINNPPRNLDIGIIIIDFWKYYLDINFIKTYVFNIIEDHEIQIGFLDKIVEVTNYRINNNANLDFSTLPDNFFDSIEILKEDLRKTAKVDNKNYPKRILSKQAFILYYMLIGCGYNLNERSRNHYAELFRFLVKGDKPQKIINTNEYKASLKPHDWDDKNEEKMKEDLEFIIPYFRKLRLNNIVKLIENDLNID